MRAVLWLGLIATGCLGKKDRLPCWVSKPCEPYMDTKYMLGVGAGETQQLADDEAVAEISRKFSALNSALSGGITSETAPGALSMELPGVTVVQRHQKGGMYYALAQLERAPLLTSLDSELKTLQDRATKYTKNAEGSDSKVDRAHYYHKAIPLVEKMQALSNRRAVVDYAGKNWPIFSSASNLKAAKSESLKSIRISLWSDPGSKDILAAFSRALTEHGFTVTDEGPDLKLNIRATEGLTPPEQTGFTKLRFHVEYHITEPGKDNRVLLQKEMVGEAASQQLHTTRQLALKQLEDKMKSEDVGLALRNLILRESR